MHAWYMRFISAASPAARAKPGAASAHVAARISRTFIGKPLEHAVEVTIGPPGRGHESLPVGVSSARLDVHATLPAARQAYPGPCLSNDELGFGCQVL